MKDWTIHSKNQEVGWNRDKHLYSPKTPVFTEKPRLSKMLALVPNEEIWRS